MTFPDPHQQESLSTLANSLQAAINLSGVLRHTTAANLADVTKLGDELQRAVTAIKLLVPGAGQDGAL
jgi:hypothetical protein